MFVPNGKINSRHTWAGALKQAEEERRGFPEKKPELAVKSKPGGCGGLRGRGGSNVLDFKGNS